MESSTLADWVGATSALLDPLVEALRRYVLDCGKLHADDTPVPVLALGLSISVTRTGAPRKARAAESPPTPPPTMINQPPSEAVRHRLTRWPTEDSSASMLPGCAGCAVLPTAPDHSAYASTSSSVEAPTEVETSSAAVHMCAPSSAVHWIKEAEDRLDEVQRQAWLAQGLAREGKSED